MASPDDLDWDDLRYLLHAIRAGTLTGAARAMRVEHTTVGRRLSALERALGAPLVLRGPDGLSLTPLGEKIAPLVDEVERAVHAITDTVASRRSRVRLSAPSGFTKLFTTRIGELQGAVSLELTSSARPADLERGEADLAIRAGIVRDAELVARKLCDSGWALYASEAYLARHPEPLDSDDLEGHELVGFDRSLGSVPPARWLDARAASATIVLRSREATDMLAAAQSGVGLAALPCMMGDEDPGLRRVIPDVIATVPISLVYRREARLSEEIRRVIEFVTAVIRDHADRIRGRMDPPPSPT